MSENHKCIHVYVKVNGFDPCEKNLIKKKFRDLCECLSFVFDCDFVSVSEIQEDLNDL